jgi:hypothetical protein
MYQPKRRRELVALFLLAGVGCACAAPSIEERRKRIKAMESQVSPEALQRRARSEAILKRENIPINQHLPVIETEREAKRRTKEEVAQRALCVLLVAVRGEGLEKPIAERVAREYGLNGSLTPKERAFLAAKSPSQHDGVQFTWKYEAAWVLLWALGYVESLGKPEGICDVPRAVKAMRDRTAKSFVADARLRPLGEILDEADRIYRYHWAVVDARINGKPTPTGLEAGVVLERHYALNWLTGYMGQEWDDVTTDT